MRPVLLVHKALPNLLPLWQRHLGRLMSPRHFARADDTAYSGLPWAADNDCFQGLDAAAYERMLDAIAGLPCGLFVTVPDVVADAGKTMALFEEWHDQVADTGAPLAFVAQDGLDPRDVPWRWIGCLFIGGSTGWKYSDETHRLAADCAHRRKWLHFGRVNTQERARHAAALGCDSLDGTSFSMFTDTYVPPMLGFLANPRQLSLLA